MVNYIRTKLRSRINGGMTGLKTITLIALICFSCVQEKVRKTDLLNGSWSFCTENGYAEWHASNAEAYVSFPNRGILTHFYFEVYGDTLYTTLENLQNGEKRVFHLTRVSADHIQLKYQSEPDRANSSTFHLKRIEAAINPIDQKWNTSLGKLYQKISRKRQRESDCPDTPIDSTNLLDIQWDEFSLLLDSLESGQK